MDRIPLLESFLATGLRDFVNCSGVDNGVRVLSGCSVVRTISRGTALAGLPHLLPLSTTSKVCRSGFSHRPIMYGLGSNLRRPFDGATAGSFGEVESEAGRGRQADARKRLRIRVRSFYL